MTTFKLPAWILFVWDILKLVILAFIIVWPIHKFIFQPFLVQGPSMEPNFFDKEYLIIEEVSYRFRHPERGEVVVFRSPHNPGDYLIKRLIGLPGERVVIRDGEVRIYNEQSSPGMKLNEDYLQPGLNTGGEIDKTLSVNEYFVLGDNRPVSLDSRSFGSVQRKDIVGRAWLRGWPPDRVGFFSRPIYF